MNTQERIDDDTRLQRAILQGIDKIQRFEQTAAGFAVGVSLLFDNVEKAVVALETHDCGCDAEAVVAQMPTGGYGSGAALVVSGHDYDERVQRLFDGETAQREHGCFSDAAGRVFREHVFRQSEVGNGELFEFERLEGTEPGTDLVGADDSESGARGCG